VHGTVLQLPHLLPADRDRHLRGQSQHQDRGVGGGGGRGDEGEDRERHGDVEAELPHRAGGGALWECELQVCESKGGVQPAEQQHVGASHGEEVRDLRGRDGVEGDLGGELRGEDDQRLRHRPPHSPVEETLFRTIVTTWQCSCLFRGGAEGCPGSGWSSLLAGPPLLLRHLPCRRPCRPRAEQDLQRRPGGDCGEASGGDPQQWQEEQGGAVGGGAAEGGERGGAAAGGGAEAGEEAQQPGCWSDQD